MRESTKKKLVILVPLLVALTIAGILMILGRPAPKEGLVFPKGNMSDSLFDSQNMQYIPIEGYEKTHHFNYIPYTVDISPVDGAVVDTGCIYPVEENYRIYFSEVPKTADFFYTVRDQYGKSVVMDFDPELSYIEDIYVENGFINGFAGSYTVSRLVISNGATGGEEYLFGYYLEIPNYDYNMLISIGTKYADSQAFSSCKNTLDQIIYTLQYDAVKADALAKAERLANTNASSTVQEDGSETETTEVDRETNTQVTSSYYEITNSNVTVEDSNKVEVVDGNKVSYTTSTVDDTFAFSYGLDAQGKPIGETFNMFPTITGGEMVLRIYWTGSDVTSIEVGDFATNTIYQTNMIFQVDNSNEYCATFNIGEVSKGPYSVLVVAEETKSLRAEFLNNTTGEVIPENLFKVSTSN